MTDISSGQAAERAIETQLIRFYRGLDTRAFDRMAAIMTPDGVWRRAGKELKGREGLLEEMARRAPNRHARHLLTNMLVEVKDDGTAVAEFYSTAFVHTGDLGPRGEAPMDLPSSLGVYTAKMRLVDGTWLMEDLRSFPAFKRNG